jgi:hypothetical protein
MNIITTQLDTQQNLLVRTARSICEIPMALLSFSFYKVIRLFMRQFVRLFPAVGREKKNTWRILNAEALQSRLVLPVLMTSAPRWNTHAIIAIGGPWLVNHSICLHFPEVVGASMSWTVNRVSDHQIVASGNIRNDSSPQTIVLSPGSYRLTVRCYDCHMAVKLPVIEVDGVETVAATAVPADTNSFYHDLTCHSNLFYLGLHYYVATLLRYRKWLPQSFIEREYLPVGNPQTKFYYGFLHAGESLVITLEPELLQTHNLYFTLYNRASFPISWYPLQEQKHKTIPFQADGTYLIRVHSKMSS